MSLIEAVASVTGGVFMLAACGIAIGWTIGYASKHIVQTLVGTEALWRVLMRATHLSTLDPRYSRKWSSLRAARFAFKFLREVRVADLKGCAACDARRRAVDRVMGREEQA